jgi:hypothetical protein
LVYGSVKPNDKPRAVPKLDAMPINKALRLLDRFGIVRTNQRLESVEMPILPDEVSPILFHPKVS